MPQVINLNCAGCGNPVSTADKECKYCRRPIVISSFSSAYSMDIPLLNQYVKRDRQALKDNPDNQELNTSIAHCYLKLKMYDEALFSFKKAIEDNFDNSETYFYAATCLLKGKKAFVTSRTDIDKTMEYINSALRIEARGIYYYFLAYIKYDFFERNGFNIEPNWEATLQIATQSGLLQADLIQLSDILQVTMPECLAV